MLEKFKAVLFDLDGTLVDTIEDLADSVNAALAALGHPQHELGPYNYFVGNGIEILVKRALPEDKRDDETVEECLALCRKEYANRWKDKSLPYPGIPEMLDELTARGFKLTILSNKPDHFTKAMVNDLLAKWKFEHIQGALPDVPIKPDPTAALAIANKLEIPPEEFLYFGDTNTDMETANGAGMHAIGVTWGFRPREELVESGAKTLLNSPMELFNL